ALAPGCAGVQAAADIIWQSEGKIRLAHGPGCRRLAVGTLRVLAIEGEKAGSPVVAGVEGVQPAPHQLRTRLDHMPSVEEGEVVSVMEGGVGEELLRPYISAANVAGIGEPLQRQQSGPDVSDAELLRDVTQALIRAAILIHDVVHARTGFVHQRGADGSGPV